MIIFKPYTSSWKDEEKGCTNCEITHTHPFALSSWHNLTYQNLSVLPSNDRYDDESLETVFRPRLGSGNIVNTATKNGSNVKSVKKGAKELSCCVTPRSENVQVWAESPALGRSDLAMRSSSRRRRNHLVHTTMSPVLKDRLFRR